MREGAGGIFGYRAYSDIIDESPGVTMQSMARGHSSPTPSGNHGRAVFTGRYDAVVVSGRDTPRAGASGPSAMVDHRFASDRVRVDVDIDRNSFTGGGGNLYVEGWCNPACGGSFSYSDPNIGAVTGGLTHSIGRDDLNAAFHGVNDAGGVAGAMRATR